jgi:hypothetical protein
VADVADVNDLVADVADVNDLVADVADVNDLVADVAWSRGQESPLGGLITKLRNTLSSSSSSSSSCCCNQLLLSLLPCIRPPHNLCLQSAVLIGLPPPRRCCHVHSLAQSDPLGQGQRLELQLFDALEANRAEEYPDQAGDDEANVLHCFTYLHGIQKTLLSAHCLVSGVSSNTYQSRFRV